MTAAGKKFGRERFNFIGPLEARPHLTASVLCHVFLLAALFVWGSHKINQTTSAADLTIASAHVAKAEQASQQKRVRDMARIRDMLEDSLRKDASPTRVPEEPSSKEPPPKTYERARTAQDLMTEAKDIDAVIKKLEQKFKAAELAAALKISEEEALKKVVADDVVKAKKQSLEKPADDIARLEQQARAALANREWQLARQKNGVNVSAAESLSQQSAELQSEAGIGNSGVIGGGGSIDMSGTFVDRRRYGAYVAAPAIDRANLKMAAGNVIGKGGVLANRIWINRWYMIGPFDGDGQWTLKKIYPPEQLVDLDAIYLGRANRPVAWQYVNADAYPFVPTPSAENAVFYGYTEIVMDEARDIWVTIGADDDSSMWFNNRLVWASGDADKPWYHTHFRNLTDDIAHMNLSEGRRKLHFKKGRNTMLFKLYNSSGAMFFSVVIEAA